jgi:hypothetical protein
MVFGGELTRVLDVRGSLGSTVRERPERLELPMLVRGTLAGLGLPVLERPAVASARITRLSGRRRA